IWKPIVGDYSVSFPNGPDKALDCIHRHLFAHAVNDYDSLFWKRRRWLHIFGVILFCLTYVTRNHLVHLSGILLLFGSGPSSGWPLHTGDMICHWRVAVPRSRERTTFMAESRAGFSARKPFTWLTRDHAPSWGGFWMPTRRAENARS